MPNPISRALTEAGTLTSRPQAFLIVLVYVAAWLIFDPDSLNWHAAATVATWIMTLFIQRAEHRDTQGLHAKLDALLHASESASNELTNIDRAEPEQIEKYRERDRAGD